MTGKGGLRCGGARNGKGAVNKVPTATSLPSTPNPSHPNVLTTNPSALGKTRVSLSGKEQQEWAEGIRVPGRVLWAAGDETAATHLRPEH